MTTHPTLMVIRDEHIDQIVDAVAAAAG